MGEHLTGMDFLVTNVLEAQEELGIPTKVIAMRGGTDGSQLTLRGLPCPNLATGGYSAHSVREFIPVRNMVLTVDLLQRRVGKFAVPQQA